MKDEFKNSADYGAGIGTEETYVYECPCGNGEIVEEHCNVPGFREHDVYMRCDECSKKWVIKDPGKYWQLESACD